MEETTPEPPKIAKKLEPVMVPPKEEPKKKEKGNSASFLGQTCLTSVAVLSVDSTVYVCFVTQMTLLGHLASLEVDLSKLFPTLFC